MQAIVRNAALVCTYIRKENTTTKRYSFKKLIPTVIYVCCIRKISTTKKPIIVNGIYFFIAFLS